MFSQYKTFFKNLILPLSQDEDKARHEFILNVLLMGGISLSFVAFLINLVEGVMDLNPAIPARIILVPLSFFLALYFFSRKGFLVPSSFAFVGTFFLLISFMAFNYGVDLPEGLMTYALIIVMSGVLISTRFAFLMTFITILVIFSVGFLQINAITPPQSYWRRELLTMANVAFISALFFIISTVSWLSNREIEKSLKRARASEAALKKERDSLEVTVEMRTRELKDAQAEKMAQLYRFAELGRLSSGLFHDLVNYLTAVSLNMEKVNTEYMSSNATSDTKTYIEKAVLATRKMENFVVTVRKQLAQQKDNKVFSLNEEIQDVLDVLSYKARKFDISLGFSSDHPASLLGDALKFNQIVLNLVTNAIDAYIPERQVDAPEKAFLEMNHRKHEVRVSLHEKGENIILSIKDYGMGIPEAHIEKIFEPFFTTKVSEQGIGLGLSLTKRIVEKDFGGTIRVESKVGVGTEFVIQLPKKHEPSSQSDQ